MGAVHGRETFALPIFSLTTMTEEERPAKKRKGPPREPVAPLPEGKQYQLILADPPWYYRGSMSGFRPLPYPTLTLKHSFCMQALLSLAVLTCSFVLIFLYPDDKDGRAIYVGLISGILGLWMPKPEVVGKAEGTKLTGRRNYMYLPRHNDRE